MVVIVSHEYGGLVLLPTVLPPDREKAECFLRALQEIAPVRIDFQ